MSEIIHSKGVSQVSDTDHDSCDTLGALRQHYSEETPFEYFDECDDSGFNPFGNDGVSGEERGIDDLLHQGYVPVQVAAVLQKDDHWMILRRVGDDFAWVRVERSGDR